MYQTQTNIIHMPSVIPQRPAHLIRVVLVLADTGQTTFAAEMRQRICDLDSAKAAADAERRENHRIDYEAKRAKREEKKRAKATS